jgi:two-component system OmpR family sensor kinase
MHRRLSIALGCVAVLVGLLGAFGTYLVVTSLTSEFDTNLRDAAARVHPTDDTPLPASSALPPMPKDLVVQIWRAQDDTRPSRTSNPAVILPKTDPGLTQIVTAGRRWDVFALVAGNEYIQIGELHSVRTRNALKAAFWSLLPVFGLLPILLITLSIIVRVSLRPLNRLRRRMAKFDLNYIEPLDASPAPEELRPFINSINLMIKRLSASIDSERKFIANAAHELRTPIAAIQLHVDNLRNAPAAEYEERFNALFRSVGRAASLVSQLLGLARAEAGTAGIKRVKLHLPQLVADVIADLLPLASERGVDLGAGTLEEISVRAVEADLRVVIKNLVDNAIRYSGEGAHVDVSVFLQRRKAVVQVMDDGPGIAETDLLHVFDRFYRGANPQEEGSGLGLSIVETLAANYGGRVELTNRGDGNSGVVARIYLPMS